MTSLESFRLLCLLFGALERTATPGRVKAITLKDTSGQVIGGLTLEGGLVRVGVQVEGRPYIDDVFRRELPAYAALLTKVLNREAMTEAEMQRLQNVPLIVRRTLRSVTARALRKLALTADLTQIGVARADEGRDTPFKPLNYMFPLVELMLAAGSSGNIRYTDVAARLYETPPPPHIKERWIFEWQPEDPDCPWPVMTTSMAERQTSTVAQIGQLGQHLARHLRLTQRERRPVATELAATDAHVYCIISTERYFTLLIYPAVHLERLLLPMQDLIGASVDAARGTSAIVSALRPSPPSPLPLPPPSPPSPARPVEPPPPPVVASPPRSDVPAPAPASANASSSAEMEALPWLEAASTLPVTAAAEPVRPPQEIVDSVLVLRGFTAVFDERAILKGVGFEIGRRGVYALMGPGGSGKSSLLGVLSGRHRSATGWSLSGSIIYDGRPLGTATRPAVVGQGLVRPAVRLRRFLLADLDEAEAASYPQARLADVLSRVQLARLAEHLDDVLGGPSLVLSAAEWRRLAIARELLAEPALLCVDEPTVGIDESEVASFLALLQAEGTQRAVLFVTHNQQHARACAVQVILLASGQIQEQQPVEAFFKSPKTRAGREYVRTGGCVIPGPNTRAEHLDAEFRPAAAVAAEPPPSPPPAPSPPVVEPAPDGSVVAPPAAPAPGPLLWAEPGRPPAVLSLRDFSVNIGKRTVVSGISLDVAERGLHLLIGPDGAERRIVLRALCGPRPEQLELRGQARYLGRGLTDGPGPGTRPVEARLTMLPARDYLASGYTATNGESRAELYVQAERLVELAGYPELIKRFDVLMCDLEPGERRVLEILRAAVLSPALLVLDEPLVGLQGEELERLLRLLQKQASERGLLLFLQDPAPMLDGKFQPPPAMAWLSAGRVTDTAPVASPSEEVGIKQAVAPPRPFVPELRSTGGSGTRGFRWLRPRVLAGMPAPGLSNDLRYDLELVRGAGINYLITLTEEQLPKEVLHEFGLESIHFPIRDMGAPALDATAALCRRVAELLAQRQVVAFHCKAGLGRTGTLLAAQLIFEGAEADSALAQVRSVEPGWVQSDVQVRFLSEFASYLTQKNPRTAASGADAAMKKRGAAPLTVGPGRPTKEREP